MSKTLLDGVNEVLKRVNTIAGDASALTTLVDSSKQHDIDIALQVINEGIIKLYTSSGIELPGEGASSTLTLVLNQREYSLATNLVQIRWPMVDRTNTQFLYEFPGSYQDMLLLDPEQNDTGLPTWGTINPGNNLLHVDRAPTSAEAGRTYYYEYDKDVTLSTATDSMPFSDTCFRAMVPAWVQLWKRERRNEFDQALYMDSIGTASRVITKLEPKKSYTPR